MLNMHLCIVLQTNFEGACLQMILIKYVVKKIRTVGFNLVNSMSQIKKNSLTKK